MKKIWNFVATAILAIMILLIAIIYLPKFFGIEPMVVVSGSMEPTYKVGSLLYVKQGTSDIEVGDAITFYVDDESLVTHRVVEYNAQDDTYTTQGDANDTVDAMPVLASKVLGKPVFNIPRIGYLADALSTAQGKVTYITAIVIVTLLLFIGDFIWPTDRRGAITEDDDEN